MTREAIATIISGLPPFVQQLGWHQALLDGQRIQEGLAYLNDRSHFVFAALLLPGAAVAALILARVHDTVAALRDDGILRDDDATIRETYQRFHRLANHWFFRLAALCLGGVTALVFLAFRNGDAHTSWWGHRQFGPGGLAFAFIEAAMVYFGTQTMVLTAFASAMFARLLAGRIAFRPFHPDGANGLAPMGRMIMMLWILALVLGAEICVALFLGYLGIEKMPLTWLLALAGLAAIPALAIAPLYASLHAIHRARIARISHLEPLLNSMLERAEGQVDEGRFDDASETLATLGDMQGVHESFASLNVWPFNPRALAGVVAVYALQLVLTLKEVLGF
ncbi:MAG TPA: hypothetical protein PLP50_12540 [Thermoanaerobaculia bacterium]|nr:hypothetical protein [Thermoanaerobaculia bacterium]HQN08859.1 hypothetical protein [Thermoanaerobaculia bacterium]HQP88418.1 hypothetical protein [Thermoanaerobaculia bacterium]